MLETSYTNSDDANDFLIKYNRETDAQKRMSGAQEIISYFGNEYQRAYQIINPFYAESYKDQSYALGNQWSLEEISYLNEQRRNAFTYNKILKFVNWFSGYQVSNRLASRVEPIENGYDETSTLMTDVIQCIMNEQNGYESISSAFKGALINGISWVFPYMDYRDDIVNGDIRFSVDPWNSVIFDPFLTRLDLSDCNFIAKRKFLSKQVLSSMFPDQTEIIQSLQYGQKDDKFSWIPYARNSSQQKLLNYTEYFRTTWDEKEILVDMKTGEFREWKGPKDRLRYLKTFMPDLEIVRRPVKKCEKAVIVEGNLLYHGFDTDGLNDYPCVPFVYMFEPSYDLWDWKLQSLVRQLRDPQTEINKIRSKAVDLRDKALGSSWLAKRSAVENPSALFQTGQGQVIFKKDTAQPGDIERLDHPGINPTLLALEQEFEKDMMDTLGLSPEVFGMAQNDKIETAGILAKMRQAAGMVAQQGVFDNLRLCQKLLTEKILKLMQKNYSPEKVALLTKKTPTPEFYSKEFLKYKVVVEEGVLTDSQRQAQFVGLAALRSIGVEIPGGDALLIKNSNLHDKNEIATVMEEQANQQAQASQMQMQLQMQQQQTAVNTLNAKAESDRALAAERLNKVTLDQALNIERISRAEDERASEILNIVKALKELDQIDLSNLEKKISILKQVSLNEY